MKIKKINGFVRFLTNNSTIAITLAPFGIYVQDKYLTDKITVNHEIIHWKQQMEMLILPFYLWYAIEWLIKLYIYGNEAYYCISFERESYTNQDNLKYLGIRKHYSWIKYIFKNFKHNET